MVITVKAHQETNQDVSGTNSCVMVIVMERVMVAVRAMVTEMVRDGHGYHGKSTREPLQDVSRINVCVCVCVSGFVNEDAGMSGLFVASGPSFKKGIQLDLLENIEIYGIISHALQLNPAPNNGSVHIAKKVLQT